jgi:hypothetical protein
VPIRPAHSARQSSAQLSLSLQVNGYSLPFEYSRQVTDATVPMPGVGRSIDDGGCTVSRSRVAALAADAWVVLLSALLLWPMHRVLWPLHGGGYLLAHDMVFTPHQPFTEASVGLGSAAPRAVPLDALVATASHLLDGAVLGPIVLWVPLLLAGWGSARLLQPQSLAGRLMVSGLAVWNPFVIERLALGQWALLWAYGALPWLIRAAYRINQGDSGVRAVSGVVCALAACSITPTGGLIGAAVATVIVWSASASAWASASASAVDSASAASDGSSGGSAAGSTASAIPPGGSAAGSTASAIPPGGSAAGSTASDGSVGGSPTGSVARSARRRGVVAVMGSAALLQLPWLVPALTSAANSISDARAIQAFAARSERPGGPLLSLLGLGGIWNADVVPASRSAALGYLTVVAIVAAIALGWPLLRPSLGRTLHIRLPALAGAGFVLAAASSLPGGSAVIGWAVREVPGAGLLRDSQKWLMPFVLLAVLSAGAAVDRVACLNWRPWQLRSEARSQVQPRAHSGALGTAHSGALGKRNWQWQGPVVLAASALPLLLLPDAMATLRTPLTPVRYPDSWQQVASWIELHNHERQENEPQGDKPHGNGPHGDVLVLPFASYRSFPWAPGRTVIDPAPRWFAATVVVDDRLVVSGQQLMGEDRRAQQIGPALPSAGKNLGRELARQGIGWVVVETDTPGPPLPDLTSLQPVVTGGAVELYRVPGVTLRYRVNSAKSAVLAVDIAAGLLVLLSVSVCTRSWVRRLVQSRHTPILENREWLS